MTAVAGPDQDRADPEADTPARDDLMKRRGAYVMRRSMFGPIRGAWDDGWRGWWGDEPPYHAALFELTHHAHDPIGMEGGTTFYFVTDGLDDALGWRVDCAAGARSGSDR